MTKENQLSQEEIEATAKKLWDQLSLEIEEENRIAASEAANFIRTPHLKLISNKGMTPK